MTHEKAIKILEDLAQYMGGIESIGCNYAIEQLKQCEVFNEPVEMLVSDDNDYYHKEEVLALFNGQAIVEDIHAEWYYIHKYCKAIKKQPLCFIEWLEQEYPYDILVFGRSELQGYYESYNNYLNQFKNK